MTISKIKEKISVWILELLLVVVGATGSILWSFNSSISAQDEKNKAIDAISIVLKNDMDDLRKENKADHDRIINILLKRIP